MSALKKGLILLLDKAVGVFLSQYMKPAEVKGWIRAHCSCTKQRCTNLDIHINDSKSKDESKKGITHFK